MTAMRFVDTNILLYRISSIRSEGHKQAVAEEILNADDIHLSVQVLQEFYVQSTRTNRSDALLHGEAVALIESWKRFPIQESAWACSRHPLSQKIAGNFLLGCGDHRGGPACRMQNRAF
jgi:predicted nucleic acid-binding protein